MISIFKTVVYASLQKLHLKVQVPEVRGRTKLTQTVTYSNPCLFSLWTEPCLNRTLRGMTTLCPLNQRISLSFLMFLFNVWGSQLSSSSRGAVSAAELLGKALFISRRYLLKFHRSLCTTWSRYCQYTAPSE